MRVGIATLVAFLVIAVGNAITHGWLGAPLMGRALAVLGPAAREGASGMPWLVVAWAMLTAATVWLANGRSTAQGALAGAVVGVLLDGGWNVVNHAVITEWPVWFTAIDVTWHAVHGAAAGAIVARLTRP